MAQHFTSNSEPLYPGTASVQSINYYPGGQQSFLYTETSSALKRVQYERAWDNGTWGTSTPRPPSVFRSVVRRIKIPHVPYERVYFKQKKRYRKEMYFDEKYKKIRFRKIYENITFSKKKTRYHNVYLTVNKLVRVRSGRIATQYKAPNYLYFAQEHLDVSGVPTTVTASAPGYPGYSRAYSGDLLATSWQTYAEHSVIRSPLAFRSYDHLNGHISEASNLALRKLYEKVGDTKVDLGLILAEREKTAQLVLELAKRLAVVYTALRKGNIPLAAKNLFPTGSKSLANDILLYQYGLRPLIHDLSDVLAYFMEDDKVYTKAKGTYRSPKMTSVLHDSSIDGVHCIVRESYRVDFTWACTVEILYKNLQKVSELGLTDLPSLAWELTPWSFVVDWFVPVGEAIASLSAFANTLATQPYTTLFLERQVHALHTFSGNSGDGYYWDGQTLEWKLNQIKTLRNVDVVLDRPSYFQMTDSPLGKDHLLNAVALLRGLRK